MEFIESVVQEFSYKGKISVDLPTSLSIRLLFSRNNSGINNRWPLGWLASLLEVKNFPLFFFFKSKIKMYILRLKYGNPINLFFAATNLDEQVIYAWHYIFTHPRPLSVLQWSSEESVATVYVSVIGSRFRKKYRRITFHFIMMESNFFVNQSS